MYIAVPGNQLKRIRLRRLHQDNSRWARRCAHSPRRYGTSRFNICQRWPARLGATAAEDRLNISPKNDVALYGFKGPHQFAERHQIGAKPLIGFDDWPIGIVSQ